MPKTPDELFSFLESLGIATETVAHQPVMTVEEAKAARIEHPLAGTHIKNLFLRNKKGRMWLVVVVEDRRVDLKALAALIGAGHLSFGSAERLMRYLGVEPGSVTPFGLIHDVDNVVSLVIDEAVVAGEAVCCHPLVNDKTTAIATADLLTFCRRLEHPPVVVNFDAAPP